MPDTNSAMIAIPSERAPAGTPAAPIVAILLPDAERASAWILVLAAALRDKLGVATSLVTAGGKNQPRTMPAPERLERRFVRAPGDFGRLVDVAAVPLASLSHRPRIIIDVTGQPDPAADDLPVLSSRAERAADRACHRRRTVEPAAAATGRATGAGTQLEDVAWCHHRHTGSGTGDTRPRCSVPPPGSPAAGSNGAPAQLPALTRAAGRLAATACAAFRWRPVAAGPIRLSAKGRPAVGQALHPRRLVHWISPPDRQVGISRTARPGPGNLCPAAFTVVALLRRSVSVRAR